MLRKKDGFIVALVKSLEASTTHVYESKRTGYVLKKGARHLFQDTFFNKTKSTIMTEQAL